MRGLKAGIPPGSEALQTSSRGSGFARTGDARCDGASLLFCRGSPPHMGLFQAGRVWGHLAASSALPASLAEGIALAGGQQRARRDVPRRHGWDERRALLPGLMHFATQSDQN